MYNSPDYAKRGPKAGDSINAETALQIVASSFRVPVYEPLIAAGEIVYVDSGDIVVSYQSTVPLIQTA